MIGRMLERLVGRDRGTRIDVPGIGPVEMALHDVPDLCISDPTRQGNAYDPATQGLLQDMIRPGDTMLDIGANISWFTVVGSRLVGRMAAWSRSSLIRATPGCCAGTSRATGAAM